MLNKIFQKIYRRKFTLIITIGAIGVAAYFGYGWLKGVPMETRYVLASAEKGALIVSVSGSGQVSASNQIDVKSKASGDILRIDAKNGDSVKAGALITQLDSRDAQKTVRDAEMNLESAKLALQKLEEPADKLSVIQAENSLEQAKESKQKAEEDLKNAYEDGFNAVASAFIDLPAIMPGLDSMLFSSTIERDQWNADWYANQILPYKSDTKVLQYKDDAESAYKLARKKYDETFARYKTITRDSGTAAIESIIIETYETAKAIAEAVKAENDYVDFVQDFMEQRDRVIPVGMSAHQSSLDSYTGITNSRLSNLSSITQTIENSKKAIVSAERSIIEKTESLAKLKAGANPLEIQSQKLAIKQRENSLRDAQEKLSDYFIRVPFGGVVAEVNIKDGESVSSGTVVATIIARQRMAEISLNEVDVAKVKVGQKTTLTFDAVEGLSIAGAVAEIDAIGTVSQGVVTYNVKVGFDTQDDRIKPGMSVSAAIITDMKQDVIMIPNAAVKLSGEKYFAEMLDGTISPQDAANQNGIISQSSPRQQPVEIGLANESMTEILSGLEDGDIVVVRTITSSASQTSQTQQKSLFSLPGTGRISGGGAR